MNDREKKRCPICGVLMHREFIIQHVGSSRCNESRPPTGDVSKKHAPRIRRALRALSEAMRAYYRDPPTEDHR